MGRTPGVWASTPNLPTSYLSVNFAILEKKSLGNPDRPLGSPRYTRYHRGLRQPLVQQDRHHRAVLPCLDRDCYLQVALLEKPLRQGQRAQRLDPTRSLAGGRG